MSLSTELTIYPKNQQVWRSWLEENHQKESSIWVIFYKKNSGKPTISWSEAVDEALCFGWIDSVKRKLDDERSIQFFSKRKQNSTWSKINKQKVIDLGNSGKMTLEGLKCIEIAKKNGSWTILDEVEELIVPTDLKDALEQQEEALVYFESLSKSMKKQLLAWIVFAKRPETRLKRIQSIAISAALKEKPNGF